jgi:hypothetical protein
MIEQYIHVLLWLFSEITKFEIILMPYFTRLIKMDFVRFEPTTSALFKGRSIPHLKGSSEEGELTVQIPPAPFFFAGSIA